MTNSHSGNQTAAKPVILYYGGCWPTNIGNAFIDIGAQALLRHAVPEATVLIASEAPRWFFSNPKAQVRRTLMSKRRGPTPAAENALDIAEHVVCDLVVFSGMAMCDEFVRVNGPTIRALRRRGIPIFLMGTGGDHYTPEEKASFGAFLEDVQPVAFISRDRESFQTYRDFVSNSHGGIDCGFFVALGYDPPKLDLEPYVVMNFDTTTEPDIAVSGLRVIRTNHCCWGPVPEAVAAVEDMLVSDLPEDYLALYAQAACTYSDRVHACVATLAYGGKARLFHSTPRGGLFEAVGAEGIRSAPVTVAPDVLKEKRQQQIALVREIVQAALMNARREQPEVKKT